MKRLRLMVGLLFLAACADQPTEQAIPIDGPFPNIIYPTAKVWAYTVDYPGVLSVIANGVPVADSGTFPMVGAGVYWTCDDFGVAPYSTDHSGTLDANGYIAMVCPANTQMIFGEVRLQNVYLSLDTAASTTSAAYTVVRSFSFSDFDGDPIQEDTVGNFPIYAAAPLLVMNDAITRANTLFSPYVIPTNSPVHVRLQRNRCGGVFLVQDTIKVGPCSASNWDYFNWWLFAHEYGHSYHWNVVQKDGYWGPFVTTALLEAFADFFAVYVSGWREKCTSEGAYCYAFSSSNRTAMERDSAGPQAVAASANGSDAQGYGRATISAFLYDLVDGTADSNGINNAPGDDDETITYAGSYLLDLMSPKCTVSPLVMYPAVPWNYGPGSLEYLLACAEKTISIRPDVPSTWRASWDSTLSYSETITEPGSWNASKIRQLWKFDLFNVGSLP